MTPPPEPISLLRQHQPRIRRLLSRLAGPDAVDDVEQDLYVAALERPPRALVALPAWISTTIRNLVAKRLRSKTRSAARERIAATPEPLPASDELVARVELEEFVLRCVRELPEPERAIVLRRFFEDRSAAEIARELGMGESTVRARLQRGIERLRERLDAKSGDRDSWVHALAPWMAPGTGVTASAMLVPAAALVLLVAGGVYVAAGRSIIAEREAALAPVSATAPPEEQPAPADTVPSLFVADRSEAPTAETRIAATIAALGRLEFEVIDAATGEPLMQATVRCLSDHRFAEVDNSGRFQLGLTPGRYDVAVLHEGYEPHLLEDIDIVADKHVRLPTVALERGTGTIEGRIRCVGFDPSVPHFVELRGAGRTRCPLCPLNGPEVVCCGWNWDRTLRQVGGDGRFLMRGLASGTYFLRPADQKPRLQPTLRLELARGEWRQVELTIGPPVRLHLELVDERGDPFVGIWKDDYEAAPETLQFKLEVDDVRTGFDAQPEIEDVRARLGSPSRLGQQRPEREPRTSGKEIFVDYTGRSDRGREPGDVLLPHVDTPFFGTLELSCARLAPNRYSVRDLPASRVKLKAICGGWATDELDLDLSDPDNHHVRLVFRAPPP